MSNYTAIEEIGTTISKSVMAQIRETQDVLPPNSTRDFIVLGSPADIEEDTMYCAFFSIRSLKTYT